MSLSKEILQKIRRIHIKTNFLSSDLFTGEYETAFRGSGMSFEEVREYVPGDEVRFIDWNVTARTGRPHLKVFREERERSLILLVDTSASMRFGGKYGAKRELAAEVAAVLAYAAIKGHDKVGLLLFSNTVECFIPPKKGRGHIWRVIEEILSFEPRGEGTEINAAATYLQKMVKRRSICVVLSDFLAANALPPLALLRGKHDIIALRVWDRAERDWPKIGLLPVMDLETKALRWFDTVSQRQVKRYSARVARDRDEFFAQFRRAGIEVAELETGKEYIHVLMELFRRRERRR